MTSKDVSQESCCCLLKRQLNSKTNLTVSFLFKLTCSCCKSRDYNFAINIFCGSNMGFDALPFVESRGRSWKLKPERRGFPLILRDWPVAKVWKTMFDRYHYRKRTKSEEIATYVFTFFNGWKSAEKRRRYFVLKMLLPGQKHNAIIDVINFDFPFTSIEVTPEEAAGPECRYLRRWSKFITVRKNPDWKLTFCVLKICGTSF